MGLPVRYFIVPVLHQTSACEEGVMMNQCRVVDNNYKEIFNLLLDKDDTQAFMKIMASDKGALLYRTHEVLGEVAYWKMDNLHKMIVFDGVKYP